MVIKHMRCVDGIIIPKLLTNKIFVASDCKLKSLEIELFNIAIQIVSEQLLIDHTKDYDLDKIPNANIFFSLYGNISYTADKSIHELGIHFSTIVYLMNNLRQIIDKQLLLATYIEEMTHHFWIIDDEVEVKYKVVEIAQRYDKSINMNLFKKYGVIDD